MSERTLFLAWQDDWQDETQVREWFPIGRLDVGVERSTYRFRYTGGAERACQKVGFPWLLEFPEPLRDYRSSDLFPLFKNRVMSSSRPDFADYLRSLDLPDNADPIAILSANGGHRVTDPFRVFPKIERHPDGSFVCRFFLHGWRHIGEIARERLDTLQEREELRVSLVLAKPNDTLAVQLQTTDFQMIGWAPRYLAADLAMAADGRYEAHVVRVNHRPIPLRQRFLIEMRCRWENYEPMSSRDYIPLIELGFEDGVGSTRGLALSD